MHLWIALFLAVLRGAWRNNDQGFDDAAGRYAQAFAHQVTVHRVQNLPAKFVLLQQAAEAKRRGLLGRCGAAQINVCKSTQCGPIVVRFFGARIGEAKTTIAIARPLYVDNPLGVNLVQALYALESTTIDLCLSVFLLPGSASTRAR
jgi:hypothetical protein